MIWLVIGGELVFDFPSRSSVLERMIKEGFDPVKALEKGYYPYEEIKDFLPDDYVYDPNRSLNPEDYGKSPISGMIYEFPGKYDEGYHTSGSMGMDYLKHYAGEHGTSLDSIFAPFLYSLYEFFSGIELPKLFDPSNYSIFHSPVAPIFHSPVSPIFHSPVSPIFHSPVKEGRELPNRPLEIGEYADYGFSEPVPSGAILASRQLSDYKPMLSSAGNVHNEFNASFSMIDGLGLTPSQVNVVKNMAEQVAVNTFKELLGD